MRWELGVLRVEIGVDVFRRRWNDFNGSGSAGLRNSYLLSHNFYLNLVFPLRLVFLPPRREGRVFRGEGGFDGHIQSRSVPFRDQRREDCQSV